MTKHKGDFYPLLFPLTKILRCSLGIWLCTKTQPSYSGRDIKEVSLVRSAEYGTLVTVATAVKKIRCTPRVSRKR